MNRHLAAAIVGLAILIVADQMLRTREAARRIQSGAIRPLVDPAKLSIERVQQFQVFPAIDSKPYTYRFDGSTWRYPDTFDAYVQTDRVERLLKGILKGMGSIVGTDQEAPTRFGLSPEQATAVRLTDASGGGFLELWVGQDLPGRDASESYVQIAGWDTVYHFHANPRLAMGPALPGKPPMIDPHVFPRAIPRKPIVKVIYKTGPTKTLRRLTIADSLGSLGRLPEGPTYEWYVVVRGKEKACNTASAFAYIGFLSGLQYESLYDPHIPEAEYGFDRTKRVLYLEDIEGAVDTLEVGTQHAKGGVYLRLRTTGQVFSVTSRKADLLFPTTEALLEALPRPSPYRLAGN